MELQLVRRLMGRKLAQWTALLEKTGLHGTPDGEATVLIYDRETLAATGSRQGNLLKYIAVDPAHQGEDLTARVLTALRQDAMEAGHRHLFLYTKPQNQQMFSSLFFYPIAKTDQVLLMENRQGGIASFLSGCPARQASGKIGAAVMNCNPFTLGHQYLVETAASRCDHLYIFVLSEDKSRFSAHTRLELAKKGVADLSNVIVCPTGKYLISSATFPTYFIKDKTFAEDIKCDMDIEVFTSRFAKALNITKRFVGTEPNSPVTNAYNERLKLLLPQHGIKLIEIERKTSADEPISASRVRKLITQGNRSELIPLLPRSTMDYIDKEFFEK